MVKRQKAEGKDHDAARLSRETAEGRGQKAEMVCERVKFLTVFILHSFHLSPLY
jgi:hypothetical protein